VDHRPQKSEVGSDRVNVVAVEAACGIHQRPFSAVSGPERREDLGGHSRLSPLPDSQDVVHTRTPALPEMFGVEPLFVALALTGAALALLHAKYLDPAYLRAGRRDAV
jgi:hypothetical protein